MSQQTKTLERNERMHVVTSHVCEYVYVKCSVKCYPINSIGYLLLSDINTGRNNETVCVNVKHHTQKQMRKSRAVKHTITPAAMIPNL